MIFLKPMYNPEKEKVVVFIIIAVHSWGLLVQRVLVAFVRAATPNKLQIFFDDDIMEILTLLPCRRECCMHGIYEAQVTRHPTVTLT